LTVAANTQESLRPGERRKRGQIGKRVGDGTIDRFNVTIERELPGKLRLDLSFVAVRPTASR
jgi:hypothetical protein